MPDEIYALFRELFPYVNRAKEKVLAILSHPGTVIFEERKDGGELVGCAVVHGQTVLLLMVREDCRGHGMGSRLLERCERTIREAGYDRAVLGVGFDYIMPGVPTSRRYAGSVHERLHPAVNTMASDFFERRGYYHAWGECNCFDMAMDLRDFRGGHRVGDTVCDVHYRWAVGEDLEKILACADDACQYQEDKFSVYYRDPRLYREENDTRVLLAQKQDEIVGLLMVSRETEGKGLGSVGCTCVASRAMHRGIGTELVRIGTRYLKDRGLEEACLGFTYSGLDRLYGASGYMITTYYFMGEKALH